VLAYNPSGLPRLNNLFSCFRVLLYLFPQFHTRDILEERSKRCLKEFRKTVLTLDDLKKVLNPGAQDLEDPTHQAGGEEYLIQMAIEKFFATAIRRQTIKDMSLNIV
jgi:hypothetical protein